MSSQRVMATWATRTDDGRTLTVEWGNPDEAGFYEPTIRVSGDTEAEREAEAARSERERIVRAVEGLLITKTNTPGGRGFNDALNVVLSRLRDTQ